VYEPPRWTCPQCDKTYSLGALGYLEELGSLDA
jgi:transposase-like protein